VRKLGLVSNPNLTGHWRGYLITSFDGHAKRHDLMIHIFQSWTQIIVYLTTPTSMSRSCAAVIQADDPEGAALVYQYQSQPLADAMRTMHMHYGTGMLRVSNGGCLAGDYYTGRGPANLWPDLFAGEYRVRARVYRDACLDWSWGGKSLFLVFFAFCFKLSGIGWGNSRTMNWRRIMLLAPRTKDPIVLSYLALRKAVG